MMAFLGGSKMDVAKVWIELLPIKLSLASGNGVAHNEKFNAPISSFDLVLCRRTHKGSMFSSPKCAAAQNSRSFLLRPRSPYRFRRFLANIANDR
jgi:hypothetical protein